MKITCKRYDGWRTGFRKRTASSASPASAKEATPKKPFRALRRISSYKQKELNKNIETRTPGGGPENCDRNRIRGAIVEEAKICCLPTPEELRKEYAAL